MVTSSEPPYSRSWSLSGLLRSVSHLIQFWIYSCPRVFPPDASADTSADTVLSITRESLWRLACRRPIVVSNFLHYRFSDEMTFENLVLIKLFPGRSIERVLFIVCIPGSCGLENGAPKGGHALLCRSGGPWCYSWALNMDFRSSNLGSTSDASFKHMTWHLLLYFPCTGQPNLGGFHHGPFAIDENLHAAGDTTFLFRLRQIAHRQFPSTEISCCHWSSGVQFHK